MAYNASALVATMSVSKFVRVKRRTSQTDESADACASPSAEERADSRAATGSNRER
jgi:hypothetical protein